MTFIYSYFQQHSVFLVIKLSRFFTFTPNLIYRIACWSSIQSSSIRSSSSNFGTYFFFLIQHSTHNKHFTKKHVVIFLGSTRLTRSTQSTRFRNQLDQLNPLVFIINSINSINLIHSIESMSGVKLVLVIHSIYFQFTNSFETSLWFRIRLFRYFKTFYFVVLIFRSILNFSSRWTFMYSFFVTRTLVDACAHG
jgi:hypothetical protein